MLVHQDILRLDIAVRYAVCMHVLNCGHELLEDLERNVEGKHMESSKEVCERVTFSTRYPLHRGPVSSSPRVPE